MDDYTHVVINAARRTRNMGRHPGMVVEDIFLLNPLADQTICGVGLQTAAAP